MTLGVAVIGCGLIGRKRIEAFGTGLHLATTFDPRPEAAAALAALGGGRACSSVEAAITDPAVDLVIVAATHDALPSIGRQAVAAGRHVVLEKPGSSSLPPLISLADEARAEGVIVRVGYNHRFHPSFVMIRSMLDQRDLGPLLWVRARYGHGGRVGYDREWRADRSSSGGGELVDQGSHLIDLTRFCVGEVTLAFAELRTDYWDMTVEDNAYLALRPSAGGFAWLHASWTEWKNVFSFELAFRNAKFEVTGLGGSYGPERLAVYEMLPEMGPPVTTIHEFVRPDVSFATELADVMADIDGRPSVGATIDDAIAVWRIIEEANR